MALFLANPVSIWTTGFQGQFDGVSLLFLLLAILVTVPAAVPAARRPASLDLPDALDRDEADHRDPPVALDSPRSK